MPSYFYCMISHQTNTHVLLAVQVGVLAPHDHVWSLHYNHEVSFPKANSHLLCYVCIYCMDVSQPCLSGRRFNSQLMAFVTHQLRSSGPCCFGSGDHRDDKTGEDASACNTSMVLLNKGQKTLE